jgi:hypothetical protein
MIACAIKRELAEIMTLIIKIIYTLLREKNSDVNPSYSLRFSRGREEAITYIFRS